MNSELKNSGFSLTEVLLAVGTLAIGMVFIGGTFLAGIHFSTIATERTIAAVAADEAFAKIKLFGGIDTSWLSELSDTACVVFNNLSSVPVNPKEFAYPSTDTDLADKQYFWSALCRCVGDDPNRLVQVTVFVSRKVGAGARYRDPLNPEGNTVGYPMPVPVVDVSGTVGNNIITINDQDRINWINDGYTIVEDTTGNIYRVIKRYAEQPNTILLDRPWNPQGRYPEPDDSVWVIPPTVSGGRYPCIAVYQTEIRF